MSRIKNAFAHGKAFMPFLTGGDPNAETTEKLIFALIEGGADLIEIGIPFSDPIAEGPVIEEADKRALLGGCTTDTLFEMIGRVRQRTDIPLVFMSYLNPVFTYGKERFFGNCKKYGIDGVIIPDMPFEEKDELQDICRANEVDLISMITPTSAKRIEMIAKEAEGFLYCVSSLGVTGVRDEFSMDTGEMIKSVRQYSDIPCAIGFGIGTPETAREMSKISDGIIVGSAVMRIVAEHGENSAPYIKEFAEKIKQAIK